jgi:hypothetical protein
MPMGGQSLLRDEILYSEPHSQSSSLVRFAPNGRYLASAAGYRLIIRDVDTLQIVQLYSCIDAIEGLEWSCDSEYVLCAIQKRGAAQVWSLSNKEWHCKIDEGPVGLAHARWSPDGRHVLATADFRLRITIWSLCDRSVFYIRFPKHVRTRPRTVGAPPTTMPQLSQRRANAKRPRRFSALLALEAHFECVCSAACLRQVGKGLDFTRDGTMMALAERTDGKDAVGLFSPDGWKPIRTFRVDSIDLDDLKWAPNGAVRAWGGARACLALSAARRADVQLAETRHELGALLAGAVRD